MNLVGRESGEFLFSVTSTPEQWRLLKAAKKAAGIHRWEKKFFDILIRDYLEKAEMAP